MARYRAILTWLSLLAAALPAAASGQELQPGRYLGGNANDAAAEHVLEVGDGWLTLTWLQSVRPVGRVTLVADGGGRYHTVGPEGSLQLLVVSPNRVLAWATTDDELGVFRRLADATPAALLGEWQAFDPTGELEWEARFETERAFVTRGSRTLEGALFAIHSDTATYELALPYGPSDQPKLFSLQALPEGGFLAWEEGDDDLFVLRRPDAPLEGLPAPANAPSEAP